MSNTSLHDCNCRSKTISYKEIKLWATAYLRYTKKPFDNVITKDFELDIQNYQKFVSEYFQDFNENCNTTLRVAFLRDTLLFPGDPYVKIAIYLEYTEPRRFRDSPKGTAAPGEQYDDGGVDINPETSGGKETQMDDSMSGPGTVTPPRCPPDVPPGRVSKVSYTQCGY